MPEICRFYGIVIRMFFGDHNPPHFHATYGSSEVLIDVSSLAVIAGQLPPLAMGLLVEWTTIHQQDLLDAWTRARNHQPPGRIEPLA